MLELKKQLEDKIYNMEKVAQVFNIEPFELYLLGGSACVLGGYTVRATRDFDFIDLKYPTNLGKVFVQLRDFDMLEYESTILSPRYRERARRLKIFNYIHVFLLSVEDIIVSKIIRLESKDIEDIDCLILQADKDLINQIIDEVLSREDLFQSKRKAFMEQLSRFKERYNV
jgi:hypothetical protein